ncbi:MAG: 16S rRNA (guanine(527)-N(7))-methyltransferase RsmG [SAR86 cluster bacterium]|uniref:Ribosomal RNA small subunit methyltransferase G n=1 Tax=SAR86 cluster bacterium TaxID=2030880 RepID=A0A2A5CJ65_9GAMM|nr:MAG: 16S rRNA (guanine(527)-N(7))-methyltransferase RsmG [SAR86 cluster bacterium]
MEFFSQEQKTLFGRDLANGIKQLNLNIDEKKQKLLLTYLEQLTKWNQAYNLSGIKDPARMLPLHLLDSLSILPFINEKSVLDVGTGAGLPGMPIAICNPDKEISLLDSKGKKTRFLFQVSTQLKLKNVVVIHDRVENYRSGKGFDIVISRAYSSLSQFIAQTRHLLGEKGKLLAMKGHYPQAELDDLPDDFKLLNIHELQIPGEAGARHLLEIIRV